MDSVLVAPLTAKKELIFIEEYFQGLNKTGLILPGGVVDKNESPRAAAIRELGEETGFFAHKLKKIGVLEVPPKYMWSQTHLFLATNLEKSNKFGQGDEIENIKVHKIPPRKVQAMIKNGEITEARTVALVLMVRGSFIFNLKQMYNNTNK